MFVCLLFIIYGIFSATAEDKHKNVNLALETVLEFNKKDNARDIKFLDDVYNFIDKVKYAINKNNIKRRDFNNIPLETFTDFIQILIQVINKFDNKGIEHLAAVFSEEIRKYHYKESKFHELIDNYSLRRFIARKLDEFKGLSGHIIKKRLVAVANKIKKEKYDENEKELIEFINSLYRNNSIDIFNRILIDLDDYRLKTRRDIDLVDLIRKGLRLAIFDYYSNLNFNARAALKTKLDDFWKGMTNARSMLELDISKNAQISLHLEKITYGNTATPKTTRSKHKKEALRTHTRGTTDEDTDDGSYGSFLQSDFETTAKREKFSFMTLYPAFIASWSEPKHTVRKEKATKRHKPRKYKQTTEEMRTLRQMYVEKNMDLKYDPYAYDHLTTDHKNAIGKGKRKTTTPYSTIKHGRHNKKSKSLKIVTMRPFAHGTIKRFDKFEKYEFGLNKPLIESDESGKHMKKYEIHLKKSRKPKHYKRPIVPFKKQAEHPIGMLMNDIMTPTENFANLNYKTSTLKYSKKNIFGSTPTLHPNKHHESTEELQSKENLRQKTLELFKTKRHLPRTTPYQVFNKKPMPFVNKELQSFKDKELNIADIRQPKSSSTVTTNQNGVPTEDIEVFEDDLFEGEALDHPTKTSYITKKSSAPTFANTINENDKLSKEHAAIFADSLSVGDLEDLGDASRNQLKLLAEDVNIFNTDDPQATKNINKENLLRLGSKQMNLTGNNRRKMNYQNNLDKIFLNRLQRLENEIKVVKTQIKDDIETIKDLTNKIQAKKQSRSRSQHTERSNNVNYNKIKAPQTNSRQFFGRDIERGSRALVKNIDQIKQYNAKQTLNKQTIRKQNADNVIKIHEDLDGSLTESNEKKYKYDLEILKMGNQNEHSLESNISFNSNYERIGYNTNLNSKKKRWIDENIKKRFSITERDSKEGMDISFTKKYNTLEYKLKPKQYIYTVNYSPNDTDRNKFNIKESESVNSKDSYKQQENVFLDPVQPESYDKSLKQSEYLTPKQRLTSKRYSDNIYKFKTVMPITNKYKKVYYEAANNLKVINSENNLPTQFRKIKYDFDYKAPKHIYESTKTGASNVYSDTIRTILQTDIINDGLNPAYSERTDIENKKNMADIHELRIDNEEKYHSDFKINNFNKFIFEPTEKHIRSNNETFYQQNLYKNFDDNHYRSKTEDQKQFAKKDVPFFLQIKYSPDIQNKSYYNENNKESLIHKENNRNSLSLNLRDYGNSLVQKAPEYNNKEPISDNNSHNGRNYKYNSGKEQNAINSGRRSVSLEVNDNKESQTYTERPNVENSNHEFEDINKYHWGLNKDKTNVTITPQTNINIHKIESQLVQHSDNDMEIQKAYSSSGNSHTKNDVNYQLINITRSQSKENFVSKYTLVIRDNNTNVNSNKSSKTSSTKNDFMRSHLKEKTVGVKQTKDLKDRALWQPTTSIKDLVVKHNNLDKTKQNYAQYTTMKSTQKTPSIDEAKDIEIDRQMKKDNIEKILLNDDWDQINPSKLFSRLNQITVPTLPQHTGVITNIPIDYARLTSTRIPVSTTTTLMRKTLFPEVHLNVDEFDSRDVDPAFARPVNLLNPSRFALIKDSKGGGDVQTTWRPLAPMVGEQDKLIESPGAMDRDIWERYNDKIKSYTKIF